MQAKLEEVQIGFHLLKSAVGLGEEIVDYRLAEVTFLFVVVHFEDLRNNATQLVFHLTSHDGMI